MINVEFAGASVVHIASGRAQVQRDNRTAIRRTPKIWFEMSALPGLIVEPPRSVIVIGKNDEAGAGLALRLQLVLSLLVVRPRTQVLRMFLPNRNRMATFGELEPGAGLVEVIA